jgi:hypothetical protein
MARKQKTPEQIIREIVHGKPVRARRVRVKTAADLEFEKMLADYKVNGAEHLASARKKMGL